MFDKSYIRVAILIAVLGLTGAVSAQDEGERPPSRPEIAIDGTPHTMDEILILLTDSPVRYDIERLPADSIAIDSSEPIVLPPMIFLHDGELQIWQLPDSTMAFYNQIESLYVDKEYSKAAEMYKQLHIMEPGFFGALTLIGTLTYWPISLTARLSIWSRRLMRTLSTTRRIGIFQVPIGRRIVMPKRCARSIWPIYSTRTIKTSPMS